MSIPQNTGERQDLLVIPGMFASDGGTKLRSRSRLYANTAMSPMTVTAKGTTTATTTMVVNVLETDSAESDMVDEKGRGVVNRGLGGRC